MKFKHILTLVVATSVITISCKKDFLETEPTEFTTPGQLIGAVAQDPSVVGGSINGLYSTMFTVGVGGTDRHDDFGQKGVDIYMDMLSSDMVLGAVNYSWYSPIARYQATVDFTSDEAYVPWRYYYMQIFGANTIIDILGGTDAIPGEKEQKITMAQAKTMRAYAYFYLTQLYAKGYGDGNAKILPIYTSTALDKADQPKSTVKDVWNLMVSDLTEAITYLEGYARLSKNEVNINVAKGLLSYVLSARGTAEDWIKVEKLSREIMDIYPKTSARQVVYNGTNASEAGFNNIATPSWIWGVDITLAQGLDLISWWGQIDLFSYSYAWAGDPKLIDEGLYNSISGDDIRKAQFDEDEGLMPTNKFFDPARRIGGQRQITTDLVYMRSDEFYLLYAEALAHNNKEGEAKTALSDFLTGRITDVSFITSLSGQALLNEIYLQTRIELWGEGKSYLAMKRNKATIKRGPNHLFFIGDSFPYDDPKLTFVIPQAEVVNNPNLEK